MQLSINGKNVVVDGHRQLMWFLSKSSKKVGSRDPTSDSGSTDDSESTPLVEPPAPPIAIIDPPPPLYALIIGINRYHAVVPLQGCVPDANDMDTFLRESLGVPANQIRNLRDQDATRAAIIGGFKDLINDTRIKKGDPIVIFYAGHGGKTKAPPGWESEDGETQYILPVDIYLKDASGVTTKGIPDRTIATLLNDLARAKGDNISVIFDCCNSGSGTRTGVDDPDRMARVVKLEDDVAPDLDREIWHEAGSRGTSIGPGFVHSGLRSHVLLAACSARELAMEENKRGVFTKTLLETLRTIGADKVTYKDVLNRIKTLPAQNPQCEGVNQDRILFNSKVPAQGRVFYPVKLDEGKYVMDGGGALGISEGAEFTIYQEKTSPITAPPLGKLVVDSVKAFSSILKLPSGVSEFNLLNSPAYAVQTRAGVKDDLRLYVAFKEELLEVFKAVAEIIEKSGTDTRRLQLVERDQGPQLGIDIEDGKVVFELFDSQVNGYGLTRLPHAVNNTVEDILPVLRGAMHYFWNLEVNNPRQSLKDKVEVEAHQIWELEEEWDDDFNPLYKTGDNLNVAGAVYIDDDDKKEYGFKIVNKTALNLYPALFYFDNSNIAIASFFQPGTAGKFLVDAPLRPNSSLTVGYGSGGGVSRRFVIPKEDMKIDIGYLKLYLTTKPLDYSNIPLVSPFDGRRREAGEGKPKIAEVWDTMKIPIIQRRSE